MQRIDRRLRMFHSHQISFTENVCIYCVYFECEPTSDMSNRRLYLVSIFRNSVFPLTCDNLRRKITADNNKVANRKAVLFCCCGCDCGCIFNLLRFSSVSKDCVISCTFSSSSVNVILCGMHLRTYVPAKASF